MNHNNPTPAFIMDVYLHFKIKITLFKIICVVCQHFIVIILLFLPYNNNNSNNSTISIESHVEIHLFDIDGVI